MRRSTTTAFGLGAVFTVLSLTGCSGHAEPTGASVQHGGSVSSGSAPLSSAQLKQLLLNESDLGEGYTRKPETPRRNDDVTVIGCPALDKLGGDAATGSGLGFTRKAKASFSYSYAGRSGSEVSEEVYSDSPAKLSTGITKIVDAMLSCPSYQVASGGTVIDVGTEKSAAPDIGDERWSQLLTFSVGGQRSVVRQTAIRISNILVIVSGSPGLVDVHSAQAVRKVSAR
ncbi:hypothetical protein ACYBSK_36510 [Streptomyces sp. BYX5S]